MGARFALIPETKTHRDAMAEIERLSAESSNLKHDIERSMDAFSELDAACADLEDAMREIQAATSDKKILAITDRALCDPASTQRDAEPRQCPNSQGGMHSGGAFCTYCGDKNPQSGNRYYEDRIEKDNSIETDTIIPSSHWISVEDRLPESDGNYLCAFADGSVESLTYHTWDGEFPSGEESPHNFTVTHWHPMIPHPALDKQESK